MLWPPRGVRCPQDLNVGVLGLGGGGVELCARQLLTGPTPTRFTPERHPGLARLMSIEMARIHGPLSVSRVDRREQHVVATTLPVFDRRKGYTLDHLRQHVCYAVRSSRQQLPPSPQ